MQAARGIAGATWAVPGRNHRGPPPAPPRNERCVSGILPPYDVLVCGRGRLDSLRTFPLLTQPPRLRESKKRLPSAIVIFSNCFSMTPSLPLPSAARFAALINLLRRAVRACSGNASLPGAIIILITRRLYRFRIRFAALAARFAAGTLRAPPNRPAAGRATPAQPRRATPCRAILAGWWKMVPEAAAGRGDLRMLLATPEMAALIEAAPQAARILRALARMLGLPPPTPPAPYLPRPTIPASQAASARKRPQTTPPQPRPPSRPRARRPRPPACGPPSDDD
jgi:hypothetical protein